MSKIKSITAFEILNSRGDPAVETTVYLDDETMASASSPSGKSVSAYEAVEILDKDDKLFGGKGVRQAIKNIEEIIAPQLFGKDPSDQRGIDNLLIALDGTENKVKLGGNAMLSVSMAIAKAAAASMHMPLYSYLAQYTLHKETPLKIPAPLFNVINGGLHAGKNVDFQEFLAIPATSKSYTDALQIGATVYMTLKKILEQGHLQTLVGDEGGFAPQLSTNNDALSLIKRSVEDAGYQVGLDVFFGLDIAASTFYSGHAYRLKERNQPLSAKDLIAYYNLLDKIYHFVYLEDPLSEDDWDGWKDIMQTGPKTAIIVGDDIISTNPYRLETAIEKKAVSGVIIKPNQIGTVIEALAVVEVARAAGLKIIVSHRSGETDDDFIADFAVAVGADYAKFGAPARGERVAKYNRLLHISQEISLKQ